MNIVLECELGQVVFIHFATRKRPYETGESSTTDVLLKKVSLGKLHISDAVDIAKANLKDGLCIDQVVKLSSLGGDTMSNVERNLHLWVKDVCGPDLHIYPVHFLLQGLEEEVPT